MSGKSVGVAVNGGHSASSAVAGGAGTKASRKIRSDH